MIRIPNGWYADALPSGEYVALVKDSHLVTDRARIELPRGQNLLFLDLSPDGIHFAGIGHSDDHCWEWVGDGWLDHGIAFGPLAVGYDAAGELHIITGPPAVGYRRYPVTAEATYADPARQVWGFTDLPNCTIGQGGDGPHGEDPAIVLIGGVRRLIEDGRCRAIKARQDGQLVSIAYCREDSEEAVIRWLTLDQLRGLQPVSSQLPQPVPVPPPTPEPPMPDEIPNFEADIAQIRAHYPTPLGFVHWAFLVEVAQWTKTQLFRKEDDNSVLIPSLGKRVSLDVIGRGSLGNHWADILRDSENLAIPVWQIGDTPADGEYVDVSRVALPGAPIPEPDPLPVPVPLPSGDLETRVRALEVFKAEWLADLAGLIASHR